MKKVFSWALIIAMAFGAVPIHAYVEIPDHVKVYQNIDWNIDENGVLTIEEGISALPTFVSSWGVYGPWRGNSSITKVIIPDNVTLIGEQLFENCVNLKEVVLPKNLETIGDNAFYGCNSVEKISISNENPNFKVVDGVLFDKEGKNLLWYPAGAQNKEYTIPEGTTEIKANAFKNCIALERVNFPTTLATIKPGAFMGCLNLQKITLPDSVTYMGKDAFSNCIRLDTIKMPPYVYLHGNPFNNTAFYNNNANWEEGGLYINNHLIAVKDDVEEYTIKPDTISIAGEVFAGTKNLKRITIPGSVKCIGDMVFANNSTIEEVIIEEGLEIIGNRAFYWSRIENITLPQSLKIIGGEAFYSSRLKSIVIPDNVIDIGEGAFESCYKLESVVLGKSLGNIGEDAFSMCSYLKAITIPDSVRTVGGGAFYNNDSLTSVYIGSGLCEFERYSFSSCDFLSKIEISEDNPYLSTKDNVVFDKSGERLIYYPIGKIEEHYTIPEGVKVIDENALGYETCETLTMPKSVTRIESYNYCTDLTTIYYMGTKEEWDKVEIAKYNNTIQEAIVHFADGNIGNVYENLRLREEKDVVYVIGLVDESIDTVTIPGEINGKRVEIASSAFKNTNIVTVVLDEKIKTIPYSAFYGCRKLENINLEHVEHIDGQAFMYCESLKEVNLLNIKSWSGVKDVELNENGTIMYFPFNRYLYSYEQYSIFTVFYGATIDTLRIKWPEVNFDKDAEHFPALFINSKVNKIIFENFTISPSLAEFKKTGAISTTKPRFQSNVGLTLENTQMLICGKDESTRLYAEKLGVGFEYIAE